MFDHVKFGVSDYAASKMFFLKALEPLGVAVVSEGPPTYGVELSPSFSTDPRHHRQVLDLLWPEAKGLHYTGAAAGACWWT
jgi:hypothetical protein